MIYISTTPLEDIGSQSKSEVSEGQGVADTDDQPPTNVLAQPTTVRTESQPLTVKESEATFSQASPSEPQLEPEPEPGQDSHCLHWQSTANRKAKVKCHICERVNVFDGSITGKNTHLDI